MAFQMDEFFRGIRHALPVMAAFVPVALILGATGAQHGLAPFTVGLMAGINFAGGSEFAAIALWQQVPPMMAVLLSTWLINTRHIMLSASLAPAFSTKPLTVTLPALFLMCDETWALAMQEFTAQKKKGVPASEALNTAFYFGVAFALWGTWVSSSVIGALLGGAVGNLTNYGFSLAFPAIFISILGGMYSGARNALPWVVSAVSAALCSKWLPQAGSLAAGVIAGLICVGIFPTQRR